jgi:hypothetical protein
MHPTISRLLVDARVTELRQVADHDRLAAVARSAGRSGPRAAGRPMAVPASTVATARART